MKRACRSSMIIELIATLLLSTSAGAQGSTLYQLQIPAQPLAAALQAFAAQSGLQVMFFSDVSSGLRAQALEGSFTKEDALRKLLQGSGLEYTLINDRTISIRAQPSQGKESGVTDADGSAAKRAVEMDLSEVVVTGTHIRGAASSASPVQVYTREDIARSAAGTLGAFIQNLPQNFNGGASETTNGGVTGGGNTFNAVGGTGVNLRGLGNDATVVLVNGHRMAPGNSYGNFVDISLIPLSAVERIEVVPDGASAIYGSDAVGGVINFILRKDFQGAESRARLGSVSEGNSREFQASQAVGTRWSGGSALVNYEFYNRTPLAASARSYSQAATPPTNLLPEQVRHGVFVAAEQSFGSKAALFTDGSYSRRSTWTEVGAPSFDPQRNPARIEAYDGTVGTRIELTPKAEVELAATYGHVGTHVQTLTIGQPIPLSDTRVRSDLFSFEGTVRGPLFALPTGNVLYAVGSQYRTESLERRDVSGARPTFDPSRDILAAFAELRIPLLGPAAGTGPSRIELTIADRDEHYNDFGSTNNPKFGLLWQPSGTLKFRATYGTSFVAPLLSDLNPDPSGVYAINTSQLEGSGPPGGGDLNVVAVFGGNPNLRPQTAKSWMFGLDWTSSLEQGLSGSLSYYTTRFSDRIDTLQGAGVNAFFAIPQADSLGADIVQFNPPADYVQRLVTNPVFVNFGADLSTGVDVIVHDEALNLSIVRTRGVDLGLAWRAQITPGIEMDTGIDATYILKFDANLTPASPTRAILNTPYNPPRLKMRARAAFTGGPFTTALFVNHIGDYEDPNVTPAVPVASWTTVDVSGTFECRSCAGAFDGFSATVGIQNLMNRDPPFVANAGGFFVNFDGANANALGRYYSVQLVKPW
jgi:outer membrane receptor protein involved in Fe transport